MTAPSIAPTQPARQPVETREVTQDGWCDRCQRSTLIEMRILADFKPVATLRGCPECRTGICAPRPAKTT